MYRTGCTIETRLRYQLGNCRSRVSALADGSPASSQPNPISSISLTTTGSSNASDLHGVSKSEKHEGVLRRWRQCIMIALVVRNKSCQSVYIGSRRTIGIHRFQRVPRTHLVCSIYPHDMHPVPDASASIRIAWGDVDTKQSTPQTRFPPSSLELEARSSNLPWPATDSKPSPLLRSPPAGRFEEV